MVFPKIKPMKISIHSQANRCAHLWMNIQFSLSRSFSSYRPSPPRTHTQPANRRAVLVVVFTRTTTHRRNQDPIKREALYIMCSWWPQHEHQPTMARTVHIQWATHNAPHIIIRARELANTRPVQRIARDISKARAGWLIGKHEGNDSGGRAHRKCDGKHTFCEHSSRTPIALSVYGTLFVQSTYIYIYTHVHVCGRESLPENGISCGWFYWAPAALLTRWELDTVYVLRIYTYKTAYNYKASIKPIHRHTH